MLDRAVVDMIDRLVVPLDAAAELCAALAAVAAEFEAEISAFKYEIVRPLERLVATKLSGEDYRSAAAAIATLETTLATRTEKIDRIRVGQRAQVDRLHATAAKARAFVDANRA